MGLQHVVSIREVLFQRKVPETVCLHESELAREKYKLVTHTIAARKHSTGRFGSLHLIPGRQPCSVLSCSEVPTVLEVQTSKICNDTGLYSRLGQLGEDRRCNEKANHESGRKDAVLEVRQMEITPGKKQGLLPLRLK
jgi:hypothetical protein